MEFGLTWAKLDEMQYVTEAEELGFTHLWVTDSPLIGSDAFVFLTVAAQQTKTMKLGMGVAVPGLRLAPVLAAGMATLNMVAPGRCFVALGTGNTAMRLLGRKGVVERTGRMGREVVQHHPDPLRLRVVNLHQLAHASSKVESRALLGDRDLAPGTVRVHEHEQVHRSGTPVLVIEALDLARFG